jgi:hypothetical protein
MSTPTIPTAKRVLEQGKTYGFTVEHAITSARVVAVTSGSSTSIGDAIDVTQWRGTAHLAKRYKYVGLFGSESDLQELADHIADKYVIDAQAYSMGLYVDTGSGAAYYKYLPIQGGTIPVCCASVSLVHADGPMWEIQVDVDASVTAYFDAEPTTSALRELVSSVAGYPEDNRL